MPTATLTSKGQLTIPKGIRDHLGVDTGDRVSFLVQDDGTVVVQALTRDVRDLAGLLRRPGRLPVSIEEMRAGIGRHLRKKHGRRR